MFFDIGHHYIGHHYIGHHYIGHHYIGHHYIGHHYIGHHYIGHHAINEPGSLTHLLLEVGRGACLAINKAKILKYYCKHTGEDGKNELVTPPTSSGLILPGVGKTYSYM